MRGMICLRMDMNLINGFLHLWLGCMVGWAVRLLLLRGTSYYVASVPAIFNYIYTHSFVLIGLFIVQIGLRSCDIIDD